VVDYTIPEPDEGQVRVESLLDQTLAIRIGESGEVETKRGPGFRVLGDVWRFDFDEVELVAVGTIPFFQQVLVKTMLLRPQGTWLVCKLIQPGKAFLFTRPDLEVMGTVDTLMKSFDPPEVPPGPFDDTADDDTSSSSSSSTSPPPTPPPAPDDEELPF
jgi:hypothetical protein